MAFPRRSVRTRALEGWQSAALGESVHPGHSSLRCPPVSRQRRHSATMADPFSTRRGTPMTRLTACLTLAAVLTSAAAAGEVGFVEDFALAKDRAEALK